MYEEIPIFFAGVAAFFSLLYIITKCYVKRKRSKSVSDENEVETAV